MLSLKETLSFLWQREIQMTYSVDSLNSYLRTIPQNTLDSKSGIYEQRLNVRCSLGAKFGQGLDCNHTHTQYGVYYPQHFHQPHTIVSSN
jgi:hypothetical protein